MMTSQYQSVAVKGILVLAVVVVLPTFAGAMLADTGVVTGNTISGGTLDLKLSEVGPATRESTTDESHSDEVIDTWEDTSHPTDGSGTINNTVELDNRNSSVGAKSLNLTVTYVENDSALLQNDNVDNTSRTLEIVSFTYDGWDLLADNLTDANGNGFVDLEDLTMAPNVDELSSLEGVPVGETTNLTLSIRGKANLLGGVGSDDGIDLSVAVRVENSFHQVDHVTDSTIQYG